MDNSTFSHGMGDSARLSSASPGSSPAASDKSGASTHWSAIDGAHDTLSRARELAHDAVDRLAGGANRMVDRIDQQGHSLVDLPRRAWSYSRSTAQQYPVQTVLVSMLAGYALARLLGGRGWRL